MKFRFYNSDGLAQWFHRQERELNRIIKQTMLAN